MQRPETLRSAQRTQENALRRSIADNGGDRLEQLGATIAGKPQDVQRRRVRAASYNQLAGSVGLLSMGSTADFLAQRQSLCSMKQAAQDRDAELQNDLTEHSVAFRQGRQEHDGLSAEIKSLKARRSNIPAEQIALRAALCQALRRAEDQMPFAGELLQLRDEERDWEGAAERLLHGFGLSILVPDGRASTERGGLRQPRARAARLAANADRCGRPQAQTAA